MKVIQSGLSCAAIAVAILAAATPARAIVHAIPNGPCPVRNAPATIAATYPAEWPEFGATPGAVGEAVVRVDLRADSSVREATIVTPIGDFALDRAARRASMSQKYASEVRECVPVEGSYLVRVAYEA